MGSTGAGSSRGSYRRRSCSRTQETWNAIGHYPIADRELVEARRALLVRGIEFEAFPVEHSLRAPAVGYRIRAGRVVIFYAPDVVSVVDEEKALSGLDLYVGDGSSPWLCEAEQDFDREWAELVPAPAAPTRLVEPFSCDSGMTVL